MAYKIPGGGRRFAPSPPLEPQFRWTFKTWIEREWRNWDGNRVGDIVQERTMTVTASTEAEAKRKIEAALPAPPARRDSFEVKDETSERFWAQLGSIEEVD